MREGGPKKRTAIGRPITYTPDVAEELCARIAEGRSLRSVVTDSDMPSWRTVWRWLQADETFRAQYAEAREMQAHAVADTATDEAIAAPDAQLGRLAFDARRWYAAKVAPRVYGEKLDLNHSGKVDLSAARERLADKLAGAIAGTGATGVPGDADD